MDKIDAVSRAIVYTQLIRSLPENINKNQILLCAHDIIKQSDLLAKQFGDARWKLFN